MKLNLNQDCGALFVNAPAIAKLPVGTMKRTKNRSKIGRKRKCVFAFRCDFITMPEIVPRQWRHNLNDFREIPVGEDGTLKLGNDSSTTINEKGYVHFIANVSGNKKNVTIKDASHVPELRTNRLSVV